MEGAGVAAAVHEIQGQLAVGFILVRGISDMPHRKAPGALASTAERDGWKVAASRNAARFLAHLVATAWPIPPRTSGDVASAGTAAVTAAIVSGASGGHPAGRRMASPPPAYPNPEVQALSEQLEDAYQLARPNPMDTFGRDNPFLPSESSSRLLRLLWQLEVWLREMVYVELRARDADWQEPIKKVVQNWPPRSLDSDKPPHAHGDST